jgi:hypothetical protein
MAALRCPSGSSAELEHTRTAGIERRSPGSTSGARRGAGGVRAARIRTRKRPGQHSSRAASRPSGHGPGGGSVGRHPRAQRRTSRRGRARTPHRPPRTRARSLRRPSACEIGVRGAQAGRASRQSCKFRRSALRVWSRPRSRSAAAPWPDRSRRADGRRARHDRRRMRPRRQVPGVAASSSSGRRISRRPARARFTTNPAIPHTCRVLPVPYP